MTTQAIDLVFGEPRPTTFNGRTAQVRTAPATETFWQVYRSHKDDLLKAGYRVRKDDRTGQWTVNLYEITEDTAATQRAVELSRATDAAVELPRPTGLDYLPYQRAGIAFASERAATLIADEMGLGKTIQAIGVINATGARRVLVICPASLRLNWAREMRKWLVQPLRIAVMEGGARWPGDAADVVIINYDILERYERELRAAPWDLLVADEAHYCKNDKAKRTAQVFGRKAGKEKYKGGRLVPGTPALSPIPAARRILLTGTPIANRPIELFPLISYLDPLRWSNRFRYAKRYCNAHHNGWGWDFTGASHLDELQEILRGSIMVRRLKADVLTDLPAKRRQIVVLPANGAAGAIAREQEVFARHERAIEQARLAVDLAKVADDPGAYEAAVRRLRDLTGALFTEISKARHEVAVAKVPYVVEHLANTSGKVIVFAHHKDVVEAIRAGVQDEGAVVITGDTPLAERQAAVDAFQNDPAVRFIIGTIGAMGVGLTLTASSHVVFAELDWVPGNVSQAEDRAHRIGQRNSVLVQHIVLDGSLDARMAQTIVDKQAVIDAALDDEHERRAALELPSFDWAAVADEARARAIATQAEREAWEAGRQARAEARRALEEARAASRDKLREEGEALSAAQVEAIHSMLRTLAGLDPDRAGKRNDVGFNRIDGALGHSLAETSALNPMQAALGRRLLRKYHRQLSSDLYALVFEGA